ncbi:MAG: putative toxin-antitoxin system toxin component, PIN family [Bacteroidales bacterium]|nr:putative toxin-antitoxin system toxin component, PIN family [Bacteroidales bacterium]
MKIIIDTNLWVSFLIGKKTSVLESLLSNANLTIYVCDNLLDEFKRVVEKPKIQKYIPEEDIVATLELIVMFCTHATLNKTAVSPVRDVNDLYLLSLAETVSADFILTGDKDLLTLESHHQTKIVTYSTFVSWYIPNREVKTDCANGTAPKEWKSR